ncbi:MAG: methyltransferase domain-containing protein [Erysipelotrichaceae bacterium]|nr:methyltransferase domain-containing protein [Erysipelotrichaceae bacterium]
MEEDLTLDYLPNTEIHIYQHKHMFRMNTDTASLGHFMHVQEDEVVLDIGTNNGALLLYANQYHPKFLIGVDIQPEACELARKNMGYHHIQNVKIIEGDIKQINLEKVDVIVCNPPYFKAFDLQRVNKKETIRIARHEVYLTLEELIFCVHNLLKEGGRFYLVHRSDRIMDIMHILREHQLEIKRLQFTYDEYKEEARGVLIEAVKGANSGCKVLQSKIIKR